MPKNNPAANVGMAQPSIKGNFFRRDLDVLTTLPPYKYVPVGWLDIPGKTHVDMSPIISIDSLPAVSPLYDGWTLDTYYYFVPYRLFMRTLRMNNTEDVGKFDDLKFPYLEMYGLAVSDNVGSASRLWRNAGALLPGSVMHRLGFQPGSLRSMLTYNQPQVTVSSASANIQTRFNMLPLLSYVSTWIYGQFNKQDKNIPVDFRSVGSRSFDRTYYVDYDDLKQVVNFFGFGEMPTWNNSGSVYAGDDQGDLGADVTSFTYNRGTTPNQGYMTGGDNPTLDTLQLCLVPNYPIFDSQYNYYGLYYNAANHRNNLSNTGLLPVTYYGDYFTSWFNEESIQKLQEYSVTADDTLLSLRKKNSDFMIDMLSMVSGNDFRSYLKFVFDAELDLCDHPILVGKDSISFGFIEVLNQSANTDALDTTNVGQSLAYSASKARKKSQNVRDINFKTREPGLLLVCAALRSTCRYFQGQDAFLYKTEFSELWHPQYSSTGFANPYKGEIYSTAVGDLQRYPGGNVYYDDGVNVDKLALPYVPVGFEYMTGKRTLSGAMVLDRYRTWSLTRDFRSFGYRVGNDELPQVDFDSPTYSPRIEDVSSTYGDSLSFNYNFVDVSSEAQNFVLDFTSKVKCFQPMKKVLVKPSI